MKATVDFLGAFMGSNARAKILRVFIFEHLALTTAFAAKRSGVSSRVTEREIAALEKLGILKKTKMSIMFGNGKKVAASKQKQYAWALNQNFKHTSAIAKFVHEVSPVQYKNILVALRKAGRIATVVLSGTFTGDDSRPVDLLIAADNVSDARLEVAVRMLERQLGGRSATPHSPRPSCATG